MRSTRLLLLLIVASLTMLSACKKKKPGDENRQKAAEQAQSTAAVVPGDVDEVVYLRSFTQAVAGLGPMIDRISSYVGDLSPFEAELRTTFGFDIRHPEQLREHGVDPDRPAILTQRGSDRILVVGVVDQEKLHAHASTVLQKSPFSYRAPVERQEQAGATISNFRRTAEGPVQAAVITRDDLGILVASGAGTGLTLEDYIAKPQPSLADREQFQATVNALEDYPIVVWSDPAAIYAQRPADFAVARVQSRFDALVEALRTSGLGLQFSGAELSGEAHLAFKEGELLDELKDMYVRGNEAPTFADLATPDIYTFIRSVVDADLYVREVFEQLAGIDSSLPDSERAIALNTELDRDFSKTIAPAFGTHAFAAFTRARVFSITSMIRSGTMFDVDALSDSFGLILSLELRERPPVQYAIDKLIENGHLAAEKTEEKGLIVYAMKKDGSDAGTMVLENDRITFLPRRQARELTQRILDHETSPMPQFHTSEIQKLTERTNAGGVAVDVDEVLNGPFGNLLGRSVPDQTRASFKLIDEFWMQWSLQQDTMRVSFHVVLNDPPPKK